MSQVRIRYAICVLPRVGSGYLCELLRVNGLGRPGERFHVDPGQPDNRTDATLTSYRAWVETQDTVNGVMGTKLCPPDWLRWRDLYPATHLLRLQRRNTIEQAISYYIANITDSWRSTKPSRVPLSQIPFNPDLIMAYYHQGVEYNQFWDRELTGRPHLSLQYEDLCANPEATLRQIFDFLGRPQPSAFCLDSELRKQRDDARVQDWTDRLRERLNEPGTVN